MLAINMIIESHTVSDITWLLWVALGFFGLMVVVGWLVSRSKKPGAEKKQYNSEHHDPDQAHY